MNDSPKTLNEAMVELENRLADLGRAILATLPPSLIPWLRRNGWWLRIAGGVYLAALGLYFVLIDEPLSAGMIGAFLVWVFWPRRRATS